MMRTSSARSSTARTRARTAFLGVALALALLTGAAACSDRVPTLEERAVALNRQFMCPICDGQTLDQSRSQLAEQMKQLIREKLAAGETEEQIKAYFAAPDRYGLAVLAAPPASGFNLTLWALPPVLAAAGAVGVFFILRSMKRRGSAAAPAPAGEAALAPYLERVDRELGLSSGETARGDARTRKA